MKMLTSKLIDFELPPELAAPLPSEQRGLARDEVRLLISSEGGRKMEHGRLRDLPDYLQSGDVLVVNTSETRPAAIPVILPPAVPAVLHFGTHLPDGRWVVEIRQILEDRTTRWLQGRSSQQVGLPGGGLLTLLQPFHEEGHHLWLADLETDVDALQYLSHHARPIQYERLSRAYPLEYYHSFFSFHPGSAEMPSAGRGFTRPLVEQLMLKGVAVAQILLHTGVSSLEEDEEPYPEYMEIDPVAASMINVAKRRGQRVIAVGTTVIRALESAATSDGTVLPYKGTTDLYVKEHHEMRVPTGLLTGFHEPRASHLQMLQSLVGREHLKLAYAEALAGAYYWHEFGDLHLLLT